MDVAGANYQDALAYCKARNASLPQPASIEEIAAIGRHFALVEKSFWLHAVNSKENDLITEWADGTPIKNTSLHGATFQGRLNEFALTASNYPEANKWHTGMGRQFSKTIVICSRKSQSGADALSLIAQAKTRIAAVQAKLAEIEAIVRKNAPNQSQTARIAELKAQNQKLAEENKKLNERMDAIRKLFPDNRLLL